MSDIDPKVQAVVFALADPSADYPDFIRMRILGLDMTPFAEIAVKAIEKYDAEQPRCACTLANHFPFTDANCPNKATPGQTTCSKCSACVP